MSHGPDAAAAGAAVPAKAPPARATAAPNSTMRCLAFRNRDQTVMGCLPSLPEGPLLVGLAVAGPQLGQGAVGGAGAGDVQAQPGLDAGDGAVGVEVPLLVGLAVAGPDLHLRAGCGLVVEGVQAHLAATAVHGELASGSVGPDLVGPAVAGPDVQLGARGGGGAGHVQALARAHRVDFTAAPAG